MKNTKPTVLYILNCCIKQNIKSYGITCLKEGTAIHIAPDLNINKDNVNALITKMNRFRLAPVHFWDVIHDEIDELI